MKRTYHYIIFADNNLSESVVKEIGGKAWNLYQLRKASVRTAPWIAIKTSLFTDTLQPFFSKIEQLLQQTDLKNYKKILTISKQIQQLIIQSSLSQFAIDEIFDAIRKCFVNTCLLSVRSSVVGEDSAGHSFAGLMDSYLNVTREDIIQVVKKIWASVYSARVVQYRIKRKLPLKNILCGVIIQEMVQSLTSGVLFTRDPAHTSPKTVISAAFGLGEGVVANKVECDTYQLEWRSKRIHKQIEEKQFAITLDRIKNNGNCKTILPPQLKSTAVLTDRQIYKLHRTGMKLEKYFKSPQDVEWAYDAEDRLFIMQTRPITAFLKSILSDFDRVWDNSNILESYPRFTLPLTFSFIQQGYECSFRNATLGFSKSGRAVSEHLYIFKNMIGILHGRIYYNLLNWYKMLSFLPNFSKQKEAWDQMIGITEGTDFRSSRLAIFQVFTIYFRMILKLITVKRNAKKFFKYFNEAFSPFSKIDLSKENPYRLISYYNQLTQKMASIWHFTLYNDFFAMKYYEWLKTLCDDRDLSKFPNLHNNLLCGVHGMESVKPIHTIIHIAESIRKNQYYQKLFAIPDDHLIWCSIQYQPSFHNLKSILQDYLTKFGDRSLEELKLEKPSLREEPHLLIRLIKNYIETQICLQEKMTQEQKVRGEAETTVRQYLGNPFKYLLFQFILHKTRQAIANRENMRFARSRLYGWVRQLFQQLAFFFHEQDFINEKEDIFYLTVDEIFGFIQGTAVTQNLKALVNLRREEYRNFNKIQLPERFQTSGIPYLYKPKIDNSWNLNINSLKGIGCSSGKVRGIAKIINKPDYRIPTDGFILVTVSTDPAWVFLMTKAKGIIVEKGSLLSHTAIIGRELGIPTIVNAKNATKYIKDNQEILMNGDTGEIQWE